MELVLEQTQQGTSHEVSVSTEGVDTSTVRITMMIANIEESRHRPIDTEKVAVCSSLRSLKPKCTIESRAKRSSINLIRTLLHMIPKYHNEDGNPARANIKQALGSHKDGDGVILFQDQEKYEHDGPQDTRPQDGERSQDDDQRLDLADDLKKAQDDISSLNTSHKTKITTSSID
ncbi:hypothetical protein Tco_1144567 [Tanacetum coccineum]